MQITELAAKVQTLGLSDKEAKVYVAALFLGPASVQKIAQQADVNRATAYVILDQLAELGLVAQSTEGKKTVFVAEGPDMLERLFERQMEQVEERRKELQALLPELEQTNRTQSSSAPIVRFYKGKEGVEAVGREFSRKSTPGSVSYGLVNYDEVDKISPSILKTTPKQRLKKKISSKIIYSYRKTVPSDPKLLRQTIKIDEPVKADISLRNDQAAFSTYAGKDTISVLIESREIVGALKQLFELAWDKNQD
ncbi:MAG TPA: helix-turn-helix domain-containing protein [Candidatus Saccharimonadales bacterium]|nr:helix-turn-helix domain-containing protein [Candidatus Saccharimonadales bacterium]